MDTDQKVLLQVEVMLGRTITTTQLWVLILLDAVSWVSGLDCLEADEKEAILSRNPAALLGMTLPASGS